tara:strand:+ start:109 stop:492 length:384 start_codon:yes stop_codon:yes gene_type:complete
MKAPSSAIEPRKDRPFLDPYLLALKHSFDFKGKTRRRDFFEFHCVFLAFLAILGLLSEKIPSFLELPILLFFLGHFLAIISLQVRRLRDAGSLIWIFTLVLGAIPIAGFFYWIWLNSRPSKISKNID